MLKKVLAVILALTMLFSVGAVSASAVAPAAQTAAASVETRALAVSSDSITAYLNYFLDRLINFAVSFINALAPQIDPDNADEHEVKNFYEGTGDFDTEVQPGAVWSVGYSGASLIQGLNVTDGTFYMAGSLEAFQERQVTKVLDDQRVRTFVISDGVNGLVSYSVVDGFGLASGDVKAIRELLKVYAEQHNIVSINVSVLHQHSCIDTFGMNTALVKALIANSAVSVTGEGNYVSGRNEKFMENLHNKVALSVKRAVENMTEGNLYYGSVDITEYIHDKREPITFDGNLNRIRFVPANGSRETWIASAGIHCVSIGASGTEVSSDFPFFIEKTVNEKANANLVYIQGAELALTVDRTPLNLPEGTSSYDAVKAYGERLGDLMIAIDNDELIDPILNVRHKVVYMPVSNEILTLAAKEGILNSECVKRGENEYEILTELGYMELGKNLAIAIVPGELTPEIAYGGAISASESYNGKSWNYVSMEDYCGKNLLIYGIANDQAGYILTDNDYRSLLTENEEINATSEYAGSTIMEAFMEICDSVK